MQVSQRYKTLYYFTESYPYGPSEQWKRNELEVFRGYFERIVVVPLRFGNNRIARNLVEGVEYRAPLFADQRSRSVPEKLRIQFSPGHSKDVLTEFVTSRSFLSLARIKDLRRFIYQVGMLRENAAYREILATRSDPAAVFHFFWGIGSVDVLPFVDGFEALRVCRFHGWDLYTERRPTGYIPFRDKLLDALDLALPCSDHGAKYLKTRFPSSCKKIRTARLGTLSKGRSPSVNDGTLRLLSCSAAAPVKRLDRLISALAGVRFPVSWTHVGDGELMAALKDQAAGLPENVSVQFVGSVASEGVLDYFVGHPFDLFVNVSEMEGVPVSIMEAFSAGIPVYATAVGGTPEIVDGAVGKVLAPDISPEELARELTAFHELPAARREELREAAFSRYEERCNAHTNARFLAELIANSRSANRG
ncbi:MAG: glycosyltransferase [Fimbriimonadaceae bacterium]|nr:glycosyltransferase [Fimbriimonadaceae bacterium]